jgi:hypothetical protein
VKTKYLRKSISIIVLIILSTKIIIVSAGVPTNSFQTTSVKELRISSQIPHTNISWIDNPTFEGTGEPWFSDIEGDITDVSASLSAGQANFEVLGSAGYFSDISGTPNASNWKEFNNTYFILPDGSHEINQNGVEASHEFQENTDQSRNRPSVHWRRNITMPVSMDDFIITSVSLSALVNGSADTNVETPNDDLSFDGAGYFATYYDYARFYVKFSNLDYENLFEVAYFQTVDLGEGDQTRQATGVTSYLNDTFMTTIDESTLIFYLTKALEKNSTQFGVTIGIDIYCEDNYNQADRDTFYSLLIKSVNLSFTYEKKMNQLTSVSWNQITDMINGTNVVVTKANLNFNYTINEVWSNALSPNSEIRILINNIQHTETIKLSSATTEFQEAKIGGYNLLDITFPYVNINFSIQVILGDEFGLNRSFSISIDDVVFLISYTETFPEDLPISEPLIFRILLIVASFIALSLGGYLLAYQRVLKYPHSVRKVRKFKRTLRRKTPPSTDITNRKKAFKQSYKAELKRISSYLRGKSTRESIPEKSITRSPSAKKPEQIKDKKTQNKGSTK